LASAKLDGIRAVIRDGRVWTRKLEPLPNLHVQRMLGHTMLDGLDGELIVGPSYADNVFHTTQSAVMTVPGEPEFTFYVFDYWNGAALTTPYAERYWHLASGFSLGGIFHGHPNMQLLQQVLVNDMDALTDMQDDYLERGYEGLILRNPAGVYKYGRSTDNRNGATNAKSGKPLQPWVMMKLKRFASGEAVVIGVEELMRNTNELEENALGLAKRSTNAEGLEPTGLMGSLRVQDCVTKVEFGIGTGYSLQERAQIWADHTGQPTQYSYIEAGEPKTFTATPTGRPMLGRFWRYKHFEVGVKDAPRFPVSLGERDARDMGDPE
jgi:DNA ligase-1